MANKKSRALTREQYQMIIDAIEQGFLIHGPNHRIATILKLEANLGLRLGDILHLRLSDIVFDAGRYRLNIVEEKTKKERCFTVPVEVVEYIRSYCKENKIQDDQVIFPITEQAVNKHLRLVCNFLELENVGSHSFRKFFATEIYINNDYNIVLVQQLLQHSSVAITQRYVGVSNKQIETALSNHIYL